MEVKRIEGLSPVAKVKKVERKILSAKEDRSRKNKKEKSFKDILQEKQERE